MPRRRRVSDTVPERYYPCGSLSLSRYHLALLQGLLDRPDGAVIGVREFVVAAWPHGHRFTKPGQSLDTAFRDLIRSLPTAWVARSRVGRLTRYQILPRGRDVVEGRIPARLAGRKRYQPGAWKVGGRPPA